MSQGSVPLTSRPEWQALKTHQAELESTHMRELFSDDPGRASRFFIRGGGLSLDGIGQEMRCTGANRSHVSWRPHQRH